MKNVQGYVLMLLISSFAYSQGENNLKSQLKAGLGLQGIDISAEIPLTENTFLVEGSAGIGGVYYSGIRDFGYSQSKFTGYELGNTHGVSVFAKADVKWYISRARRERKGRKMLNNAGSYFGISSKFNQNNEVLGKTMVYELYFGKHVPMGKKFIFSYFGGVGQMQNMDQNYSAVFPSLGVKFSYVFFSF